MMRIKDMPCGVPGCGKAACARAGDIVACNTHYLRWFNNGTFERVAPVRQTHFICNHCGVEFERIYGQSRTRKSKPQYCSRGCQHNAWAARADARREARFWSYVSKGGPNECWPWRAARDPHGYGRFQWAHGKPMVASRAAYFFAAGVDAGDLDVCHSCDNPPCCNPRHLWLGTAKDNTADMIAKGRVVRGASPRGEAHPQSRITAEQALYAYHSDEPLSAIAARLGITRQAVKFIKSGTNWAHVTGARDV